MWYYILKVQVPMGLHETINIDGLLIDLSEPYNLSEEDYVQVIRYLFNDSKIQPRSNFFYKEISESSYFSIFYDLKENQAMLDFLQKLFLLNEKHFNKQTKKELDFFFDYKKRYS
jgi:hypothetical protein